MQVPAWLPRAAAARPDRVAVQTADAALTYAELLDAARAVAGEVPRGRPLAVEAEPTPGFAVTLHACLLAGVPLMPVDLRWAPEERARREELARGVEAAGDPGPDRHELDAPALVMFTSGTTAAPKRVVLTYGNLAWSALGSAVALGLDPDERWLCPLPLAHVGGLSILVRSAIYATTAILTGRFDATGVRDLLMDGRATLVSLVPTQLARLLDAGLERPPGLRAVLLGGAPCPPALARRARSAGVPVVETYGMTEAASQIATGGVPLPGACVELAPDGEIVVSGPPVAGGGPLATGDLGEWDDAGRLRVIGRKADTIVSGGENVAPAEVEAVLAEHPAIADAAVVGRPDPEWGEALVALVVPAGGDGLPPEGELREFCAARLARFKIPKRFEAVAALPRNAAGKLVRSELRRR